MKKSMKTMVTILISVVVTSVVVNLALMTLSWLNVAAHLSEGEVVLAYIVGYMLTDSIIEDLRSIRNRNRYMKFLGDYEDYLDIEH